MSKTRIYILRGGAPDKFNYNGVSDEYKYIKIDRKNLNDLTVAQITRIINKGDYIVSGSEDDIWYANRFNSRNIILPNIDDRLIDKNSEIYIQLSTHCSKFNHWIYPEFTDRLDDESYKVAKAVRGSGSREVLVEDGFLASLIGKPFVNKVTYDEVIGLKSRVNCKVIRQKTIPNLFDLTKATANLVFRNGKLLGYVWTEVEDKTALTTNWTHGYHVVNEFTDKAITEISNLLLHYLSDGIVNMDFHIDEEKQLNWLTEFNWRIGNNFFEAAAAGVDLFDKYIKDEPFKLKEGKHKFCRYWQCMYFEDNKGQIVVD